MDVPVSQCYLHWNIHRARIMKNKNTIEARMFIILGPLLLTWFNVNPSMDK